MNFAIPVHHSEKKKKKRKIETSTMKHYSDGDTNDNWALRTVSIGLKRGLEKLEVERRAERSP